LAWILTRSLWRSSAAGRRGGQRAPGRRPRLRGGPLAHPAGDDLCPRPAPRPPDRPAWSRPLALAASHQRPPTRRPGPVAACIAWRVPDAAVLCGVWNQVAGRAAAAGVSARVCPDKSEVMVNGPGDVYMERKGRIEKVAGVTCRVLPVRLTARPGGLLDVANQRRRHCQARGIRRRLVLFVDELDRWRRSP
jgi:hypothetical protein